MYNVVYLFCFGDFWQSSSKEEKPLVSKNFTLNEREKNKETQKRIQIEELRLSLAFISFLLLEVRGNSEMWP